jgi:4-oxalocrotonate tautomerase
MIKGSFQMPIIRIEIGKHGKEQRRELIHKVTEVVVDVLKVPEANCMVLLKEIADENWGVGGKTIEELKESFGKQ